MYKQGVLRAVWSWGWVLGLSLGLGMGMGSLTAHATEKQAQQSEAHCNHVVINEFMSARQRVIADKDGDYEDWIELYNCSDKDIDLTDWYLSDRYDRPKQWQFPSTTIPAKGFLTLWASGKDRTDGTELHTNFRIDAAGEPLLLSNAEGELVDEIPPIVVNNYEIVGRYPDGVGDIAILAEPSPGAPNTEPIAPALIDAPEFSHESGFYDKEFTLTLSHPDESVTIYYTLDGSEPDPDNLDGSTYRYKNSYQQPPKEEGQKVEISQDFLYNEYKTYQYDKPIKIKDRTYEPDRISQISTTFDENPDYFPKPEPAEHWLNDTIYQINRGIKELNRFVRRLNTLGNRAIRKFYKVTTSEVRPLGNRRLIASVPEIAYRIYKEPKEYTFKGTPVRAIAVKENEHRRTISPIATNTYFIGDREEFSLPIVAITVPEKELFDYDEGIFVAGAVYDSNISEGKRIPADPVRPFNWIVKERKLAEIHFNFPKSTAVGYATIRSSGLGTRSLPNKSIKIYPEASNSRKGFPFPLFKDGKDIDFTRVMLRNNSADGGSHLKDNIFQEASNGLGFSTQRSQPYISVLNGEYNGILTAKYRYDKKFVIDLFKLEDELVDVIKIQWPTGNSTAQSGNLANWKKTIAKVVENTEEIEKEFDLESTIDYFATQIYLDNDDWPHNNLRAWRYAGDLDKQNSSTDGKWRWMMFDVDAVGGRGKKIHIERNRLEELFKTNDSIEPAFIFRSMIENESYKYKFITRMSDLLNTYFISERIRLFTSSYAEKVKREIPRHMKRWNRPSSYDRWMHSVNEIIEFAEKRPAIQRKHLQEFFDLGDLYTLSLRVLVQGEDGHTEPVSKAAIIKLNTLTLGVSDDELEKPVAASARATNMEKYLAFPWSGEYFAGMPIRLTVQPRPGYRFSHWEGRGITEDQKFNPDIELTPEKDTMLTAVLRR